MSKIRSLKRSLLNGAVANLPAPPDDSPSPKSSAELPPPSRGTVKHSFERSTGKTNSAIR